MATTKSQTTKAESTKKQISKKITATKRVTKATPRRGKAHVAPAPIPPSIVRHGHVYVSVEEYFLSVLIVTVLFIGGVLWSITTAVLPY